MISDPFFLTIAGLFGAIVGSFLNVVILRLPQPDASIVFPASHCPKCLSQLAWYENIPVASYLFLKGRCRHCRANISVQYPLVEIMTALLAAAVASRFGLSPTAAGLFLFSAALMVVIFIDIQHQIIPDVISLPGILIGFAFSFVNAITTWQDSLIGLLTGGGILYTIALLYYLIRKQDGMGGGDIKLLAMIGSFLGWQSLPFVIFASSVSGSLIGILAIIVQKKDSATRIPFGPFLSLAALLYMFYFNEIQNIYRLYLTGSLF